MEGISAKEAERRVSESDEGRREYVRAAGGRDRDTDWDDSLLYDLVVNTHRTSFGTAATLIVDAAAAVLETRRP